MGINVNLSLFLDGICSPLERGNLNMNWGFIYYNIKCIRMIKIKLIILLVISAALSCNGQKIEMKKIFGGYVFYQDSVQVNLKELTKIFKDNPESLRLIKQSRNNNSIYSVLSFAGGFVVGWSLGPLLNGNNPNWELLGIGVGIIGISIPIAIDGKKKAKKAIDIYNSTL